MLEMPFLDAGIWNVEIKLMINTVAAFSFSILCYLEMQND